MTTTDTDAPERIWAGPDKVDGWRWPFASRFPAQHNAPLIEYIRADLAKPRVKPLVWDGNSACLDFPCSYSIDGDDEDGWIVSETGRTYTDNAFDDGRTFPTEEAAMAAADALNEAHVLAWLSS